MLVYDSFVSTGSSPRFCLTLHAMIRITAPIISKITPMIIKPIIPGLRVIVFKTYDLVLVYILSL